MIISDNDLLILKEMLVKHLSIAYCAGPGTFETDMQGDDQYDTGYVKRTIHATLNEWAHSWEHVKHRNASHDVEEFYKE